MKLNTYLNFGGNCEEAFKFYEKHLGGKTTGIFRWSQMPDAAMHTPPGMENKVLHGRLEIGETHLLAADVPGAEPIRSAYLTLTVDSSQEAERIFSALSEGGQVTMKMEETFFAHRFGQVRDKFGVLWMIIHEKQMG
ncbi:MAG: VOC family protein [Acidobacteriaceae bacterium]|jgi:PhnB protein